MRSVCLRRGLQVGRAVAVFSVTGLLLAGCASEGHPSANQVGCKFQVVRGVDQKPLPNLPYEIVNKDGTVVMKGVSNAQGETDWDQALCARDLRVIPKPKLY